MMLRHDSRLISDAKVNLHTLVELKTAKHDARADEELISVGADAARPLRVIERELRPKIFPDVILKGHAGKQRVADVVAFVGGDRIANRSLDIEIPEADAASNSGGNDPGRPVGKGGNAGGRLKSEKGGQNIVSIFLIGAEQALLDGDCIPVGKTGCRRDRGYQFKFFAAAHEHGRVLRDPLLERRHVYKNFIGFRGNELQSLAREEIVDLGVIQCGWVACAKSARSNQ